MFLVKISAGTAARLGLQQIKVDALPTTAYLMEGENCLYNCSFCPQARGSSARKDLLSRVIWPEYNWQDLARGLAKYEGELKRICVQVVCQEKDLSEILTVCRRIKVMTDLPLSVSARLENTQQVDQLLQAGANKVGIAVDAADPQAYQQIKGGSFAHKLALLEESARRFPGRISTHLIIGLGETEAQAIKLIGRLVKQGISVGLFAFTPVKGTALAHLKQPPLAGYRRIQAAHYLLQQGLVDLADLSFTGGKLIDYGLPQPELRQALTGGEAFLTSGCPGCNRPYYNEKPGGIIYNYPRPLTEAETSAAIQLVLAGDATTADQEGEGYGKMAFNC